MNVPGPAPPPVPAMKSTGSPGRGRHGPTRHPMRPSGRGLMASPRRERRRLSRCSNAVDSRAAAALSWGRLRQILGHQCGGLRLCRRRRLRHVPGIERRLRVVFHRQLNDLACSSPAISAASLQPKGRCPPNPGAGDDVALVHHTFVSDRRHPNAFNAVSAAQCRVARLPSAARRRRMTDPEHRRSPRRRGMGVGQPAQQLPVARVLHGGHAARTRMTSGLGVSSDEWVAATISAPGRP